MKAILKTLCILLTVVAMGSCSAPQLKGRSVKMRLSEVFANRADLVGKRIVVEGYARQYGTPRPQLRSYLSLMPAKRVERIDGKVLLRCFTDSNERLYLGAPQTARELLELDGHRVIVSGVLRDQLEPGAHPLKSYYAAHLTDVRIERVFDRQCNHFWHPGVTPPTNKSTQK